MKLFSKKKPKIKIITHSGNFHADDIFAVATIALILDRDGEKYEITRTRDESVIATGDYVVDVGGEHDPEIDHFDHHQKNVT